MDYLESAKAIRKLYEDPKKWTKNVFARDADGGPYLKLEKAASYCIRGAYALVNKTAPGKDDGFADWLGFRYADHLADFNNKQGYEAVIKLLDDKIAEETPEPPQYNPARQRELELA